MTILEYIETWVHDADEWLWRLASEVFFLQHERAASHRRAFILSAQVEGAHLCVVLLDEEKVIVKTYELEHLFCLIIQNHLEHHNPQRISEWNLSSNPKIQILDYRLDKVEGSFQYVASFAGTGGPYPGRDLQWVEEGWIWI